MQVIIYLSVYYSWLAYVQADVADVAFRILLNSKNSSIYDIKTQPGKSHFVQTCVLPHTKSVCAVLLSSLLAYTWNPQPKRDVEEAENLKDGSGAASQEG